MAVTRELDASRLILADHKKQSLYSTSRINPGVSSDNLKLFGEGISGLMDTQASFIYTEETFVLKSE